MLQWKIGLLGTGLVVLAGYLAYTKYKRSKTKTEKKPIFDDNDPFGNSDFGGCGFDNTGFGDSNSVWGDTDAFKAESEGEALNSEDIMKEWGTVSDNLNTNSVNDEVVEFETTNFDFGDSEGTVQEDSESTEYFDDNTFGKSPFDEDLFGKDPFSKESFGETKDNSQSTFKTNCKNVMASVKDRLGKYWNSAEVKKVRKQTLMQLQNVVNKIEVNVQDNINNLSDV